MAEITVVEAARRALGPVGAQLPASLTTAAPPLAQQRAAVARLARAGYRAAWTNEVIGKDALVQLALLIASTEQLTFGTCIANIWTREPQTMHAAAAQLAQAFPGRFVLGLGVGYPQQAASIGREWGSPLATMRAYRERMDSPTAPPAPGVPYPKILAANGPKMLALAAEIADGALPAGKPPEYTAQARQILGPDKLLVVAVSTASALGSGAVPRPPGEVAAAVREHLAAGADHVNVLVPIGTDFETGLTHLEELASALPQ